MKIRSLRLKPREALVTLVFVMGRNEAYFLGNGQRQYISLSLRLFLMDPAARSDGDGSILLRQIIKFMANQCLPARP